LFFRDAELERTLQLEGRFWSANEDWCYGKRKEKKRMEGESTELEQELEIFIVDHIQLQEALLMLLCACLDV